ncbi:MAG: adenine glycosylase [Bacteroidota bacterium]|jgi:A/G-specific adenine glycosylase|nr:adenine glycosylase [Bacteroidota bacterium]
MPQTHPVSKRLISWYKKNKRDLPWRETSDPYRIWLSEIILQQTQVIQGLSYYERFIAHFPTVKDLAHAPEDKVMKLWQGLGYYSRARNLHATAKKIDSAFHGKFPDNFESIKDLKGIGDYTAAAIASFAFDLPYAVVDGNVSRVLSRLFDIDTPVNSSRGKKEFQLLADELLNHAHPAQHNSAMMEFGALLCRPQNPKCETCPVQEFCLAYQHKTIALRPVKEKKITIKNRYFHYFLFNYEDWIYIQKRTEKDIWQNLYEFFKIETEGMKEPAEILKHPSLIALDTGFNIKKITISKKHILSHQHIFASFYEMEITKPMNTKMTRIKRNQLETIAFPQLIIKYLKSLSYY